MIKGKKIKLEELKNYISTKNNKIDLICVSQSGYERYCHISEESFDDAKTDLELRFVEFYECP